jgi:single-stranded DNA-binding protein
MPSAKITVVGRLVRDVEKSADNQPFKSAVAVDGMVRQGGEYKTKFYDLAIWGGTSAAGLVEAMAKKGNVLKKGSLVMVTGTPTYDVYTKDSVEKVSDGIKVDSIEFVADGKKADTSGEGSTGSVSASAPANESSQGSLADEEDDIPLL